MPRHRSARAGMVLLEVIVAMTILALGGASVAAFATASLDAVRRAHESEMQLERASAFLDVVALWPRADLDRHLGTRPEGAWRMRVDRPTPTLYEITLADSASGYTLLSTMLYRPEASHAMP